MKAPVCSTFALLLLWAGTPLLATGEESLKEAFEDFSETVRKKDASALTSFIHPSAVIYLRGRVFPVDIAHIGTEEFQTFFQVFFDEVISADLTATNVSFRVSGETGMVWGFSQFSVDARRGGGSNFTSRFSAVFVRQGDSWKLLQWHASALPSGDQVLTR